MNHAYARQAYQNNQVTTAPQKKLIVMLYDGAIKNLRLAKMAMEEKKVEKINTHLIKAQDIIMELMTTLNFELGGEIAKTLHQLYDYMYRQLIKANIDKDVEAINEVEKYMEELRAAWEQI